MSAGLTLPVRIEPIDNHQFTRWPQRGDDVCRRGEGRLAEHVLSVNAGFANDREVEMMFGQRQGFLQADAVVFQMRGRPTGLVNTCGRWIDAHRFNRKLVQKSREIPGTAPGVQHARADLHVSTEKQMTQHMPRQSGLDRRAVANRLKWESPIHNTPFTSERRELRIFSARECIPQGGFGQSRVWRISRGGGVRIIGGGLW